MTLTEATAEFPSLADIDCLRITVGLLSQLTLPKVTGFHSTQNGVPYTSTTWNVYDGLLSLPNLATLSISPVDSLSISASTEGDVELAGLQSSTTGNLSLRADYGAKINMPQLTALTGTNISIEESDSSAVSFPKLNLLQGFTIQGEFTLLPNQTFVKTASGYGGFSSGLVTNEGTISVPSGGYFYNVLPVDSDLLLNGSAALSIGSGAMLEVSRYLVGRHHQCRSVPAAGNGVAVTAPATTAPCPSPQYLEAMSADLAPDFKRTSPMAR